MISTDHMLFGFCIVIAVIGIAAVVSAWWSDR